MRNESLKDKIAIVLAAQGWTQRDLAHYLGINESQISRWVAGKQSPRWVTCYKFELLYENSA